MLALTAHAYNVIDLPENMTFSDALGVFNADEITRITVSDSAEGKYTDLTKDEINEFYSTIQDMTVYRKINPTPFRGISVNIYTNDGVKSYMLNSGLQIGMYGSNNYVCYKLNKANTEKLLYLDSMYRDAEEKVNGEEIHRVTSNDFRHHLGHSLLQERRQAKIFCRMNLQATILKILHVNNFVYCLQI